MRMITAAAAVAALALLPAPAAFADPQAGLAFDATDTTCAPLDRRTPACVHFTAEAVAAYRLGEDGLVLDDVQVSCTAVSPDAVEMRIDCSANDVALPGASSPGGVVATGGFVDLEQSYTLEVCYSATLVLHWADWTTPTMCADFSFPVGM